MKTYVFTIETLTTISVTARNLAAAIMMVTQLMGIPERSIKNISIKDG